MLQVQQHQKLNFFSLATMYERESDMHNWCFSHAHTTHHHYLHSAFSFSGSDERMKPCVHLGHSRVLAWVPNSSLLAHRLQEHQKNFASCRCCRLFSVPCIERERNKFFIDTEEENEKWMCEPAGCKHNSGLWCRLFGALLLCVRRARVSLGRRCDWCSAHSRDTSSTLRGRGRERKCPNVRRRPRSNWLPTSRKCDEFPPHWTPIASNHFEFDSQSHPDCDSTMPECLYLVWQLH